MGEMVDGEIVDDAAVYIGFFFIMERKYSWYADTISDSIYDRSAIENDLFAAVEICHDRSKGNG